MTIRLGLVGVGKIAHDQHIPAIAASPEYELVCTASRSGSVEGIPAHSSIEEMLAAHEVDAVSLCQPPHVRYDAAKLAIEAGKHVFLEKPPGARLRIACWMTRDSAATEYGFCTSSKPCAM